VLGLYSLEPLTEVGENNNAKVQGGCGWRSDRTGGARHHLPHIRGDRKLPCVVEPTDSTRFWISALEQLGAWLRGENYFGNVVVTVAIKDALDNPYTDTFTINADNPVEY